MVLKLSSSEPVHWYITLSESPEVTPVQSIAGAAVVSVGAAMASVAVGIGAASVFVAAGAAVGEAVAGAHAPSTKTRVISRPKRPYDFLISSVSLPIEDCMTDTSTTTLFRDSSASSLSGQIAGPPAG
jgi:hypothetical protein